MRWSTTAMQIELDDEGIITVHPVEGFAGPETLEIAKENLASISEHALEKLKGAFFYLPPYYVNVEATRYYGKHAPNVPCVLVGDSFIKKMVGNFLLGLINSKRPIKLFSDEVEAKKWLRQKIKEAEISKSA